MKFKNISEKYKQNKKCFYFFLLGCSGLLLLLSWWILKGGWHHLWMGEDKKNSLSLYQNQNQHQNQKSRKKNKKEYYCPMHPHIVSPQKGSCPICGMDLVLRSLSEKKAEMKHHHSSSGEQRC